MNTIKDSVKTKNLLFSLIVFSFIFIFLFTFVSSIQISGIDSSKIFKSNTPVDIRHTITSNNTLTSSITANITVLDPKNNVIVSFKPMSFNTNSNDFNYTVPAGFISKTGIYTYTVFVYTPSESTSYNFEFKVTPTGENGLIAYYFIGLLIVFSIVSLGIYKKDITTTLLGTFGLYFVGLWVLINGLDIFKNWMTDGIGIITLGFAGYLSLIMAMEYTDI